MIFVPQTQWCIIHLEKAHVYVLLLLLLLLYLKAQRAFCGCHILLFVFYIHQSNKRTWKGERWVINAEASCCRSCQHWAGERRMSLPLPSYFLHTSQSTTKTFTFFKSLAWLSRQVWRHTIVKQIPLDGGILSYQGRFTLWFERRLEAYSWILLKRS